MAEDWKQRYLEEARSWEQSEALLRKTVSRVALAATGVSAPLDALLERIQKHAKAEDLTPLKADLDELVAQLRTLDAPGAEPLKKTPDPAPPQATAVTPARPDSGSDADSPGSGSAAALPLPRPADIRELLLTLIDELVVLQPGLANLETLRENLQLDQEDDWRRALARVVSEVRGLLQKISSDKQALEQLMLEVSEELGDISQALGEERGSIDLGAEHAVNLQSLVSEGVASIQEQIERETDIGRLKEGVSQSLAGIREGISGFMEKDAARLEEALERNAALQARVTGMEAETGRLREQISTHRRKLMHDALTGVGSRLAYDETLARELSRFRRYGEVFSLAVLDIDFFKRVNDGFGHAAGDKALKLVAGIIDERIRESDFLFRIGGEEFVMLLPKTDPGRAAPLVEVIRTAVGDSGFHFENRPVPITISAGLSGARKDDDAITLFSRADEALYKAKKGGRNQLVTAA